MTTRHNLVPAADAGGGATPIWFATDETYEELAKRLPPAPRNFAANSGFRTKPGQMALLPDDEGNVGHVLFGLEPASKAKDPFLPGKLATMLPRGIYQFANDPHESRLGTLAFALGGYRFDRYRKRDEQGAQLACSPDLDHADLIRIADGVCFARDLINTPANDMGPEQLGAAAKGLAARYGAKLVETVGDDLLRANYPLIHAVGRASAQPPRLLDLTWGDEAHTKVTLVGKGVCFDSGGLDIKPESAMLIMKKDMGGAAAALAAAQMIMDRGLPIRLRVLIPAVENAISGSAFRPLDVYRSRKGLSVEIGNTDAEGRLVLADALALADEERPDLLIDLGTLTGAARVALGPDLPPLYTDDDSLAEALLRAGTRENDPLWRLPLWAPYERMLDSKVADINNVSGGSFAGSITCALFLRRFVSEAKRWAHLDVYAWTPAVRPGRPGGGECQAARAIYSFLCAADSQQIRG